jgi:hypothetical protein
MKVRLLSAFVLVVGMAALVLSPSALLRIDSAKGQSRGAEGLAPVLGRPGCAGLRP